MGVLLLVSGGYGSWKWVTFCSDQAGRAFEALISYLFSCQFIGLIVSVLPRAVCADLQLIDRYTAYGVYLESMSWFKLLFRLDCEVYCYLVCAYAFPMITHDIEEM
jgi:hypothetical protein